MKSFLILSSIGAALLPLTRDPAADAAPPADATGTIKGRVVWKGERPDPLPPLVMKEKEAEGCQHGGEELDDTNRTLLIAENGGVQNIVLEIEVDDQEPEIPSDPIVFDQHGCRFEPHVVVFPVGATLRFDNSDETNHNIHTYSRKNRSVNKNVAGGSSFEQTLDKAEVIEVKCDIHPWMNGYLYVSETPHHAVSDADGGFTLEGLPPGEYEINWWHEKLGKGESEKITVEAGAMAEVQIEVSEEEEKGGRRGRRRRR